MRYLQIFTQYSPLFMNKSFGYRLYMIHCAYSHDKEKYYINTQNFGSIYIHHNTTVFLHMYSIVIPLIFQGIHFCGLIIFDFSRIGKFVDTCIVINMCPHILYFVEHFSSWIHKRKKSLRSVSKYIDETTVHKHSLFVNYTCTQLHSVLDFLYFSCATLSNKEIVFGVHR